jgi:hypothetical protein
MYIITPKTASWKPIFISTDCMTILCQPLLSPPCLLKQLLSSPATASSASGNGWLMMPDGDCATWHWQAGSRESACTQAGCLPRVESRTRVLVLTTEGLSTL